MAPGGGSQNIVELDRALELVRTQGTANMSQYHKDLVKWARNVDKRYAWLVLFALWLSMMATLGPYRVYSLIFAKVTADGVYTREEATWPVSMIFTVENLVGFFVSIIIYHISFRNSMLIGGLLLVLANALAFLSTTLWVDVIVIGVVQGIGFAFIFTPLMEIVNHYFLRYRTAAFGFALCGGTVSVFVWSPVFQWALETFPWRYSYLFMALIGSINILMVPILKPNPQPLPPETPAQGKNVKLIRGDQRSSTLRRMSMRGLSYQSSLRRQANITISRKGPNEGGLDRQGSIISVNPFASSAGIERKISRVIVDGVNQQQQQQQQQDSKKSPLTKQSSVVSRVSSIEPYETISLSEAGQVSESEFEAAIIWNILKKPGFHFIWFLELIYYWTFTIYCLIVVDYGIDRGCSQDEAESLLNFQSVGELIGRIGLTILVDMRYLSNRNVVILNLLIITGLLVLVTQVNGYFWMAGMTVAIAAFSSLLYILLNGLLVDFLGERQVTLGYGMASMIVGVLITFRPAAVGFFRDTMGSYDPLMICIAISCAIGAVLCVIEPALTRMCSKKDEGEGQNSDNAQANNA